MAGHKPISLTPEEVRCRLELELQGEGEELDAGLWESLVELGHVEDVQQGEMSIRELAAKHGEFSHVLGRQGKRRRQQEARELPPDDRLEVLSDLLSQRAAQEPDVLSFRTTVLARSLLPWGDVDAWVKAQRAKDGPHTRYLSVAVPEGYQLGRDKRGVILTDPPLTVSQEGPGLGVDVRLLAYGVPDDPWERKVPTALTGVLEGLRALSENLATRYGWRPSQATVFVLTGLPVPLSKGRVTKSFRFPYRMMGRLTIEVDPRVSPRELLALYRQHRKELLGGSYKPMDRKHLELARFYEGRREGTWRQRMAEWNGKQDDPAWHYTDWRNFRRDCVHAWERLFGEEAHNGEA